MTYYTPDVGWNENKPTCFSEMGKFSAKHTDKDGKFDKRNSSKFKKGAQKKETVKTGKIGKPQKSKKNKKLKQTFDSNSLLNENRNKKLNNLPIEEGEEDNQEVPRKVKDLMKLNQEMKANHGKVKKKKMPDYNRMEKGMTRPMAKPTKFVRGKNETERNFYTRVEIETKRVLLTAQLEDKYKMDLSNPSGNKFKDPITGLTYSKASRSEGKKQKDKERKQKKKEMKAERRMNRQGDFSYLKDEVAFGDVAMQPPSLNVKPRKAKPGDKPAQRSLLLHQIISPPSTSESSPAATPSGDAKPVIKSLAQRPVGQSVKRKYLSMAQKRITDQERDKAINLYRKMRNKKYKHTLQPSTDS